MAETKGEVALVTGAGAGIGAAIATRLVSDGWAVACADIDRDAAQRVVDSLTVAHAKAMAIEMDVSNSGSVDDGVERLIAELGVVRVVVNNAGILDEFRPVLDCSEELWNRVLSVNLTGQFLVAKATLPSMIESGRGTFVNIASGAGLVGGLGGVAYTSSKHAVVGLTRQISVDYGPKGVRANAICPGSIDTEMSRRFLVEHPEVVEIVKSVPSGRQGKPEEIASLAAFLASDASAFMTGAAVPIDGGWTTR